MNSIKDELHSCLDDIVVITYHYCFYWFLNLFCLFYQQRCWHTVLVFEPKNWNILKSNEVDPTNTHTCLSHGIRHFVLPGITFLSLSFAFFTDWSFHGCITAVPNITNIKLPIKKKPAAIKKIVCHSLNFTYNNMGREREKKRNSRNSVRYNVGFMDACKMQSHQNK